MTPEFTLIVIVVFFVSSLAGAFVLFKVLKSTALIKKVGYQAGGALAGFLLIYSALYYSFQSALETAELGRLEHWTIVGTAQRGDTNNHGNILVRIVPPTPRTRTDESGLFYLTGVQVTKEQAKGDIWPDITIESEGYFPTSIKINAENDEIDNNKKRIDLKSIAKLPANQ